MRISPVARGALAGVFVSVSLWAADALTLGRLGFAGVEDQESQARVVAVARGPILEMEARLMFLHAACGAGFGALATVAGLRAFGRFGRGGVFLPAAAMTLLAHGAALFGMMARYPQVYADRYWLRGGWRAALQHLVTHRLGPWPFDILLVVLVALPALLVAASLLGNTSRRMRGTTAAAAAVVLLVAGATSQRVATNDTRRRPTSLLVLAADSLRTDRIREAVMPQTARLSGRGTLFRHAFTPVARTFPSWVSILTGRETRGHGVRTMFPAPADLAGIGPTFMSVLRDRGYRTFVISDFAGDIFPRFDGGFAEVDAPTLTVDDLARSTVLAAHDFSLPLLRLRPLRALFPEWRNLASLSDPEWLTDAALRRMSEEPERPYAGVVFYSTAHFPYVAPYPDYLRGASGYAGPYLYHAPPVGVAAEPSPLDIEQIRGRYDAALTAVDRAMGRIYAAAGPDTLVVVLGDHGEELYDRPGIAGHGDTLASEAQRVPLLMVGPGIASGQEQAAQVRLTDLAATVLALLGAAPSGEPFGDGVSLFSQVPRPLCVETDMWFWPDRPRGLAGHRLTYPGIGALLALDVKTRQIHLGPGHVSRVESSKDRGLVLGHRMWHERLTPTGILREEVRLPGVPDEQAGVDLPALFESRCVAGDAALARLLGGIVYVPQSALAGGSSGDGSCPTCGLGR